MRRPNCSVPGDDAVFVPPIALIVSAPALSVAPCTVSAYPLAALVLTVIVCACASLDVPFRSLVAYRAAADVSWPKPIVDVEMVALSDCGILVEPQTLMLYADDAPACALV